MLKESLLLTPLLLSGTVTTPNENINVIGKDFSKGIYTYSLQDKFYESPNTIEAWIKLGLASQNESYGVIFGNYNEFNEGSVNLSVNKDSFIELNWNSEEIVVTFNNYKLKKDTWYFISVVRDKENKCFKLYIDGELKQTININVGQEPKSFFEYRIGADWADWHDAKTPFKGQILSVSAYSKALSSKEVYEDYIDGDNISYLNRDSLLFNTYLDYKSEIAIDTSRYGNHAKLETLDYFYDDSLFEAKDYTFAVIPDPQMVSHHRRDLMHYLGDYILANYENQKIKYAFCVGDNADASGDWDNEFGSISNELYRLDGKVGFVTTPGNHDYDDNCTKTRNLTWYNKYYSQEKLETYPDFGGVFQENNTQNCYYLTETEGVKYLLMSIEFGAGDDVLAWANEVASSYPDRRIIVVTHGYLSNDGEYLNSAKPHSPTTYGWKDSVSLNNGDQIYEKFIKKHKNMFMVLCGHIPVDDITYREDVGENGNVIMSFLIDGQGLLNNAASENLLALLNFDEKNQEIYVNYVSTITGKLFNKQNQFVQSFKGYTDILSTKYYDENGDLIEESSAKEESNTYKIDLNEDNKTSFLPSLFLPLTLSLSLFFSGIIYRKWRLK